jgi:ADP-heptose:LPS heptosyltransferase
MIMADGGAMHIAAALNRPIIALFGDSNPLKWRPWGVPHIVLQENTNHVQDIKTSSIVKAWITISNKRESSC